MKISFIGTLILSFGQLFSLPIITSISPTSGPARSATSPSITITGSGFLGATAVNFGSLSLGGASFTINNDLSITMHPNVLPKTVPSTVGVTVTAPSGTSLANHPFDYFTYQGSGLAYIPDFSNGGQGSIYVYDATPTLIATITDPAMQGSETIAITPDGKFAYCINLGSDNLTIVDTALNASPTFYPLDSIANPICLANSPGDGNMLLIANNGSGTVTQLDITNRQVPLLSRTITVGTNPTCVSFLPNPSANRAFVANRGSDSITIIDTSTGIPTDYFEPGILDSPAWITVTPVNETSGSYRQIVLNDVPNGQAVFYTDLDGVTPQVPFLLSGFNLGTPNFFPQILTSSDNKIAYVTNTSSANVFRIDLTTLTPTLLPGTITAAGIPNGLSLTPSGLTGFVGDGSNQITIFDAVSLSSQTVNVGTTTTNPAITPDQAPVAYATYTFIDETTVQFDGSSSLSPAGTISDYLWDFGDGSPPFHGAIPPQHVYAPRAAPYIVTLTVTNSAGTSLIQTFNGQMVYNNGGPQARQTIQLSITLAPPNNPHITQTSDKFLTQACYENTITFSPSTGNVTPASYLIYKDAERTKFVGLVSAAGPLRFTVCERKKHTTYFIFPQDVNGNVSPAYARISI